MDQQVRHARRLKSWLRTSTSQRIFNSLAILNIHKEELDKIYLIEVAKEFVKITLTEGITLDYFVTKTYFDLNCIYFIDCRTYILSLENILMLNFHMLFGSPNPNINARALIIRGNAIVG